MSSTYSDRAFSGRLHGKIKALHEARSEAHQCVTADDYGSYREQMGYLRALRDMTTLMQDVEREMNSNTRDK